MTTLAQHPPAVKVGGRRLSVSAKPKPHNANEPNISANTDDQVDPVDYPRPAPPAEEQVPRHEDEEQKKEKKQHRGSNENEKKFKESAQQKMEMTRPTKDIVAGRREYGAGGRIGQPAGRGLTA